MMIDNIQNNQIAHAMGKTALPHPGPTNKPAADGSDATLQVSFADLINQAIQVLPDGNGCRPEGTGATPVRPTYEPREHPIRRRKYRNIRHLKILQRRWTSRGPPRMVTGPHVILSAQSPTRPDPETRSTKFQIQNKHE